MIWKRWLKRTVGAVVLVLVVRTVWLIGEREWRRAAGEKELAAAVAETEATDPDWRWEALDAARKKPAEGRNSAEVLRQVSDLSPPEWLPRNGGKQWEPDTPPLPANVRHPDSVVQVARETLAEAGPAVTLALTLQDLPDGYARLELTSDVITTKLPHVDAVRHAAALLKWDVVLATEDQDAARAVAGLRALLNTSRSIGDDPFLVCQILRMGTRVTASRSLERTLAQVALPDPALADLYTAWAADAEEPLLLYGLRGDRAVMDLMFQNLIDGAATPDGLNGLPDQSISFEGYAWWLYRVRFLKDRAYYHRYLTAAVEVARKPVHEQPAAIGSLPPLPGDDMRLAQLFLPAVEKCANAHWRNTAEARCAVVGIACERFRLKHSRWPETLTELSPEYLAAVPLDPFDGNTLRYRTLPDGVVIHTVGRNPSAHGPALTHPGLPDGTDIGFRLWNPDQRRKPASTPMEPDKP